VRVAHCGGASGRSALPGESRPAHGRDSGVRCTPWLG